MSCNYQKIAGCKEQACPYIDRTQCSLFVKAHKNYLLKPLLPFTYFAKQVENNNDQVFLSDNINLAKSFCAFHSLSNNTKVLSLTLDSVVAILQEQYDELGTFPFSNVYYLDIINLTDKQVCWIRSFINILTDRIPNVKIGIYGSMRLASSLNIQMAQNTVATNVQSQQPRIYKGTQFYEF